MGVNKIAHVLRQKIHSSRGETIVETLVSVLISALSLLLLATAIGTSVRLVMTSRDKMEEHYVNENSLVSSHASSTNTKDGAITSKEDGLTLGSIQDVVIKYRNANDETTAFYEKKE